MLDEDEAINGGIHTPQRRKHVGVRPAAKRPTARVPLKSSLQLRSERVDGRRVKKTVAARSSPENLYSDQSDDEPWHSQSAKAPAKKAPVEEQPA